MTHSIPVEHAARIAVVLIEEHIVVERVLAGFPATVSAALSGDYEALCDVIRLAHRGGRL